MRGDGMAMALSTGRVGQPERRFARLFHREIKPQLGRLESLRQRQRQRLLWEALITATAALGTAFLLLQVEPGYAVLGGAVAAVLGALLMQKTQRRYLDEVRSSVMPAVCEAIGGVTHAVGPAPGLDLDRLATIGLLPPHDRREVDDVFEGVHRNTVFAMAEVRLRCRRGRKRGTRTVFRGLVFVIETPKEIPTRILLAKDAGLLGNWASGWIRSFRGMNRVSVPHAPFEARFEAYADEPAQALETVTPGLCAALVELADAHGGGPVQAAFAGRHFYLAMPKRRDQFRLGSLFRSVAQLEQEAGRVLHDVQQIHRLIDRLHGEPASLLKKSA